MESIERRYAAILTGGDNSPLNTDGYKFSMAQAGFPLRREAFYLHFRKSGPKRIPFDFGEVTQAILPRPATAKEDGFLHANGYGMTPAMAQALAGTVVPNAAPKGVWINEQEPIMVPEGPSFLVSWLEAMTIAFQFPIQVATALDNVISECRMGNKPRFTVTCDDEAEIVRLVAEAMGKPQPEITVDEEGYRTRIRANLAAMKDALGGEIHRAFEVGTRAMTCMAMHRIVLEECRAAGIDRTANVRLAYDLYMVPVGTTGHEHQQRWGNDPAAFTAIRDMRPEPPSYLFDTYDPINSGIPAVRRVIDFDKGRNASVRFDSGNQPEQLRLLALLRKEGIRPFYIFMDGYNAARTGQMEDLCNGYDIPRKDRHYGIGGYLVAEPADSPFTRNRCAMVYKLCQTAGRPVRKEGGDPGKASIPGLPTTRIHTNGERVICQRGEILGGDWLRNPLDADRPLQPSTLSPATKALIRGCQARLNQE